MKILILEDKYSNYKGVIETLKVRLPNATILPDNDNDWQQLNYWMNNDEFSNITKQYSNTDYFITDIRFKDDKKKGFKFLKFLETDNNYNSEYDFILMSNGGKEDGYNLNKYTIKNVPYYYKGTNDDKDIGENIFDILYDRFLKEKEHQVIEKNNKINKTTIKDGEVIVNLPSKGTKVKTFISKIETHIDSIILFMFRLFITFSIAYAIFNIVIMFIKSFTNLYSNTFSNHNITTSDHSNDTSHGIEILTVVENLFFYILPLFILVGFYSYYKRSLRENFNAEIVKGGQKKAIKSLNTSKLIFLSSVLSFVIIKTIEALFFRKDDVYLNPIEVISYGIFIILLMAFILLYHKMEDD